VDHEENREGTVYQELAVSREMVAQKEIVDNLVYKDLPVCLETLVYQVL